MRMQNRLAANTGSYEPYTLEQALDGIAAAGYRYVELAAIRGAVEHVPLDADAKTVGQVQRMLNQVGLIPISLSSHSDLTTEAGLADGRRALALCERMGIDIMNTAVGGPFNEDEDEAAFLAHIGEFADYAAARNVVIGIEIHGTLTGTGLKTRKLIEKVNRENVRINYDTSNSEFFSGVQAEQDLPDALPYVVHCHLKDTAGGKGNWNFPALGEGRVDFKQLFSIFEGGNYAGPFSVEIEFEGEPRPALDVVDRAMADSYQYLGDLGLS